MHRLARPVASMVAIIATLPLLSPALHASGAWNREPDGYYLKLGIAWSSAAEEYGHDALRRLLFTDTARYRDGTFGTTEVSIYGEYGLTSWLTLVGSTQFKVAVRSAVIRSTRRDTTSSASGLGDVWVSGRVRMLPADSRQVAALSFGWKIPTGSPLQQIPLGTGTSDFELAAATGTPFDLDGALEGYAQGSFGCRLRGEASNEIFWRGEIGLKLSTWLLLQGTLDGVSSSRDFTEADPATAPGNGAFTRDQSYARWSTGVIYAGSEGMEFNATYGGTLDGRNTLDQSTFSLGIAWKR